MIINGKYNKATVFTDNIESEAINQVKELCDQEFTEGEKIAIMPDVHAGKGCTIGTTMTITDKVVPNLVGVDIGCGILVANLGKLKLTSKDFEKLDERIKKLIPSGFSVNEKQKVNFDLGRLHFDVKNTQRVLNSLGSLGGGNHFIEIDVDNDGFYYLLVHSGSRGLGVQVAKHYQDLAINSKLDKQKDRSELIQSLKSQGREREIESTLKNIKPEFINKDLAYLEDDSFCDYLSDMEIAQEYAALNRRKMINTIINSMNWIPIDSFDSVHNFIDLDQMILRKGATDASKGKRLVIPLNMRDGSLICVGKGNPDWNYSAPHGAGRVLSRTKAKKQILMSEFERSMYGVYTTSVSENTLDESPMAYKPADEIEAAISDTVEILERLIPVYNFKAN